MLQLILKQQGRATWLSGWGSLEMAGATCRGRGCSVLNAADTSRRLGSRLTRRSAALAHEHNLRVVPGEGGGGVQAADHEVLVHDADIPVGEVRLAALGVHKTKDS